MAYLRHSYTPHSKFEINPQKSSENIKWRKYAMALRHLLKPFYSH